MNPHEVPRKPTSILKRHDFESSVNGSITGSVCVDDTEETILAKIQLPNDAWLPCAIKIDGFSLLVNINFQVMAKYFPLIPPGHALGESLPGKLAKKHGKAEPKKQKSVPSAITEKPAFEVLRNPKPAPVRTIRTVHLKKRPIGGLGISIKGGRDSRYPDRFIPIAVSKVYKDLAANEYPNDPHRSLYLGDVIHSVDGISLKDVSHNEAVQIFINTEDSMVELKVQFYMEIYQKLIDQDKTKLPEKPSKNKNRDPEDIEERREVTRAIARRKACAEHLDRTTADMVEALEHRFPNIRTHLKIEAQSIELYFPLMFSYVRQLEFPRRDPVGGDIPNILAIDFCGQEAIQTLYIDLAKVKPVQKMKVASKSAGGRIEALVPPSDRSRVSSGDSNATPDHSHTTDPIEDSIITEAADLAEPEAELKKQHKQNLIFCKYVQLSSQVSTSAFSYQASFNGEDITEMSWLKYAKFSMKPVFCVLTPTKFYAFNKVPSEIYKLIFKKDDDAEVKPVILRKPGYSRDASMTSNQSDSSTRRNMGTSTSAYFGTANGFGAPEACVGGGPFRPSSVEFSDTAENRGDDTHIQSEESKRLLVSTIDVDKLIFQNKPELSLNSSFMFNSTTHFYHWLSKMQNCFVKIQ